MEQTYSIELYEKDSDVYDKVMEVSDYKTARQIAEAFAKFVKEDCLLRKKSNGETEPYDTVIVSDDQEHIFWDSAVSGDHP